MWKIVIIMQQRSSIRESSDIGSEIYDDLISLEMAMKEMVDKNMISKKELLFLDYLDRSPTFSDAAERLEVQYETFSKTIHAVCSRLAHYLGGDFTDEGLIEQVVERNNLPGDEKDRLRAFLESRERYSIKREPFLPKKEVLL